MKTKLNGIYLPIITPFNNGELDSKSYIKIVENTMSSDIDGYFFGCTTGESPCLTKIEKKLLTRITLYFGFQCVVAGIAHLILSLSANKPIKLTG